jgi:hypothetical protein
LRVRFFGGTVEGGAWVRKQVGVFAEALVRTLNRIPSQSPLYLAPVEITRTPAEVRAEAQLTKVTSNWTSPVLIRQYKSDRIGLDCANAEASVMAAHGYGVAGQSGEGGHLNVGTLVATGAIGALFGLGRSKGNVTITFQKR